MQTYLTDENLVAVETFDNIAHIAESEVRASHVNSYPTSQVEEIPEAKMELLSKHVSPAVSDVYKTRSYRHL